MPVVRAVSGQDAVAIVRQLEALGAAARIPPSRPPPPTEQEDGHPEIEPEEYGATEPDAVEIGPDAVPWDPSQGPPPGLPER